jgi:hypothetical protein
LGSAKGQQLLLSATKGGHWWMPQRKPALSPYCTMLRRVRTEGMWGNPDDR